MSEILFRNNAVSVLDSGISANDVTLNLTAGHGARFPNPGAEQAFIITVQEGADFEIMRCTGRVIDTLTVVRGQEGTTARAFSAGASVEMRVTGGSMEAFVQGPKTLDTNKLLGRFSVGTGIAESVSLGTGLEFNGGALRLANSANYALLDSANVFTQPQTVPDATAAAHALNRQTGDGRYGRLDQANVFTEPQQVKSELRVDRADTNDQGGRLVSRRASDNADGYYWQTFGSGSTPTFRLMRAFGTPAQIFTINDSGAVTVTGALTLPASNPTDPNHATRKAYVDAAIAAIPPQSVSVVAQANITSAVAQIDLALPSGPAMFILVVGDLRPSAQADLRLRTSNDGTTFQSGASDYGFGGSSQSFINLGPSPAATDTGPVVGQWTIFPGAATTPRFSVYGRAAYTDSSNVAQETWGYGIRNAAGRQQAIRLFMSTGNINRATIRLIGVT